jgi:hypothetical protein
MKREAQLLPSPETPGIGPEFLDVEHPNSRFRSLEI